MSKDIDQLVEELSGLTVLEMAKLKDVLEEKWGVTAAAPMMAAAPVAAGGGEAAPAAESTDFQVTLSEAPSDKRLGIIKALRELLSLALKEAKEMAEGAPIVVKESAPKKEADEIKAKLEAAGGKVTLKGL